MFQRTLLASSLIAILLAVPGRAGATAGFPSEIQTRLALSTTPACALCHTTGDVGGKGTVNTPFGRSIRAHGLVANDTAGLDSALDAEASDGTDSDGDGIPDITELRDGTDPNTPNAVAGDGGTTDGGVSGDGGAVTTTPPATNASPEPPQYGCSSSRALGGSTGDAALLTTVGLALITLRRRGRARRPRSSSAVR